MASTPVTTQKPHTTCTSGVVNPLRDRSAAVADGGGKLREKGDQNTRFPDKKNRLSKDPPRPPVRVAKATSENLTAPSSTTDADCPPSFYDEAWDIRLPRLGLASISGPADLSSQLTSSDLKSAPGQPQLPVVTHTKVPSDSLAHRCPPDGAAAFETCSSQVVSSTSSFDSAAAEARKGDCNVSYLKAENSPDAEDADEKKADTPVPPAVMDEGTGEGLSTPTPSNSWFPPPPPTPLHLTLLPEPEGSTPGRYHEHRRAFELDEGGSDEGNAAPSDPSDSISLPPLSPPPPPPPLPCEYSSNASSQPGRASAASSLNLPPPPPPLPDLSVPPPAVPPRDPTTTLQTTMVVPSHAEAQTPNMRPPIIPDNVTPNGDTKNIVEGSGVTIDGGCDNRHGKQNGSVTVSQQPPRSKSTRDLIDGRSVVPWEVNSQDLVPERAGPNVGFSESLPQWVPPQHSEAPLQQRVIARPTNCVPLVAATRHRSTKSQGCDVDCLPDACFDDEVRSRPLSLAARSSANSHHHHHRRRHTTSNFGGVSASAVAGDLMHAGVVTAEGVRQRTTLRMNSDSAAIATCSAGQSRAPVAGDVWGSPVAPSKDGFDGDSMSQFVRVGYDVRPTGRPGQKQQQQQLAHLSKSSHSRSVAAAHRQIPEPTGPDAVDMPESMTRSLIMLSDQPDDDPSGSAFPWPAVTEQAAAPFPPSSASQKTQQTRICQRMRALHLTGGGSAVLSPQDAAALQYSGLEYAGQRHSLGSSRLHRVPQAVIVPKTSPESSFRDMSKMTQSAWLPHEVEWIPHAQSLSSELRSPQEGYILQTQISCPSQVGGYRNSRAADEMAAWADVEGQFSPRSPEVLLDCRASYTAPTQFAAPGAAYPGQSYMLWPRVVGSRRRRHGSHTTQPIIVSAASHDRADLAFAAEPPQARSAGACSTKSGAPQHQKRHERPRVLVANRRQRPNGLDMATAASLPIEEQPWFHGSLSRVEAEVLLRSSLPGSFLVRTSETSRAAYSLSIRRDRDFLHMKISYDPKSESFILGEYSQPYPSVPVMVYHYTRNLLPVRGTKPILLRFPLCRSTEQSALQTP